MSEYFVFDFRQHDDEDPPTLGVREPRKPKPPTRNGGAEADLLWTPDPIEAVAGARMTGALQTYPRVER